MPPCDEEIEEFLIERIRWMTNHIPDPESHHTRDYGVSASWVRLLRCQVFEVDPLTCMHCGAEMKLISVTTAPALVNRLVRHVWAKRKRENDPFSARAPPPAQANPGARPSRPPNRGRGGYAGGVHRLPASRCRGR